MLLNFISSLNIILWFNNQNASHLVGYIIPAFRRWRLEDQEFKVILLYIVGSRPASVIYDLVSTFPQSKIYTFVWYIICH